MSILPQCTSRSVWDLMQERYQQYGTVKNRLEDFTEGDYVQVITPAQDHRFFYSPDDTFGYVVDKKNNSRYLTVNAFDSRHMLHFEWGFEPQDLLKRAKPDTYRMQFQINNFIRSRIFKGTAKTKVIQMQFSSALVVDPTLTCLNITRRPDGTRDIQRVLAYALCELNRYYNVRRCVVSQRDIGSVCSVDSEWYNAELADSNREGWEFRMERFDEK